MKGNFKKKLALAAFISMAFLAVSKEAAAQYYPPPPPPYPPPYAQQGPTYPPPSSPPRYQYPRDRNDAPYFSPYLMFSAGHYSGLGVGNGTPSTQSGGMTALGGTFGGYVTYPGQGPVRIGIDARLMVESSANSTQFGNKITGGLAGFRIDGSGSSLPIVPYFQFEIGGVGTNNGTSYDRTPGFAYQAQFGADIPILSPQVSARFEYGTGQVTGINNANHTLQSFSAGIVFHIR